MALLWHLKSAHTSCAERAELAQSAASAWTTFPSFSSGCDVHWLLEEPSLHQASFPSGYLRHSAIGSLWALQGQAHTEQPLLGCTGSLGTAPWEITHSRACSISALPCSFSQPFLSPLQHPAAPCHGGLCSLCNIPFPALHFTSPASPPRQIT